MFKETQREIFDDTAYFKAPYSNVYEFLHFNFST
jgi:hypothetical protein